MRPLPSLPATLDPLAKRLESLEPKILVVIGTGISTGATALPHASWLGLLKHGAQYLVDTGVFTEGWGSTLADSLDVAFSPFDLDAALEYADLVERNLMVPDPTRFGRWLDSAFGGLRIDPARGATLEALRELQQAGAVLLTTNYDGLLSEATGLPPVTWQDHEDFLRVITGQRPGILHVHGHWRRPETVILGRTSYDRIVADSNFQDAFKSLWLGWSWLYTGCGNGLDDPNLGRLLQWGRRWGNAALPHYFLSTADNAVALARRLDRPENLVSVGYEDHREVAGILHSITPAARPWPFARVDDELGLFRNAGSVSSVPFPSRQEYLEGHVPAFAADAVVQERLAEYGWAFVLDVASVGKTTLALRLATSPEQREHPSFYLDLSAVGPEDGGPDAIAAMRRLSRPRTLLVVDNCHHQPELTRQLWDRWRERPQGSRLLLIATRMQRAVITTPLQDQAFFEHHATNPAIELRPTPEDLWRIALNVYRRLAGPHGAPLADPPPDALRGWHRSYASALGAFSVAVLAQLSEFARDRWDLPLEVAAEWVREKWLSALDAPSRENLLCLAVFGAQELELRVQTEALPRPDRMSNLLRSGLVARMEHGPFGQHHHYALREPGWGRLILAAQESPVDEEKTLVDAAVRSPVLATALIARLRGDAQQVRLARLWSYLASHSGEVAERVVDVPLPSVQSLIVQGITFGKTEFVESLWSAVERDPDRFAARAWETQLHFVATFLETAKRHGRDTVPLWEAIERDPVRLAAHVRETPLGLIGSFLETAKRHGRDTVRLWEAIESDSDRLAARACAEPLGDIGSFLETAKRHGRDTVPLWEAIERDPKYLPAHARETPLHFVGSFLETAKRHGRDTVRLWEAIERDSDRLAAQACTERLGDIGSFLETAKRHGRDTVRLWEAIESDSDRLAAQACAEPLGNIGSFLETAKRHGRDTARLWDAIERDPERLAVQVWESPLEQVRSFLETAKRHGRDTARLWEAIERSPDQLAARAWETQLGQVGSFLKTAKQHGRDIACLWEAFESSPGRFAARAWGETELSQAASLLETAKQHGRDTARLWEAIECSPDRFATRAWEASLGHAGSFLETAKRHGRDTAPLWEAIERGPDQFATWVWEAQWEQLGPFLETATRHGRQTTHLWDALMREPDKLSLSAGRATAAALASFCRVAPTPVVEAALIDFQPTRWDAITDSEPFHGVTWLASASARAGREDLRMAIIDKLLTRRNPRDFPPQTGSFREVMWLVENVPESRKALLPAFFSTLCTSKWLGSQYTAAPIGSLASGVRMLALRQPVHVRSRFLNPSLGIRLRKELARFADHEPHKQLRILELLGSTSLFGVRIPRSWVANLPLDVVASLPVDVLPHSEEANLVEEWQSQLWLGLHTVTAITGKALEVPQDVITRTLDLWRENLAESAVDAESAEHRLNQRMVRWLQSCPRGLLVG